MKKILASVLAAASILSMTVTASAAANEKAVTKPGEITYEVPVTAPKVTLNLVMPAKMTAALNPYGAEIKIDPTDAEKVVVNGIISTSYKVTNKSTDYGVYLDATAITTVTTSDKAKWNVKSGASATAGTKGADMALISNKTLPTITSKKIALISTNAAQTGTTGGALMLDSSVTVDKANGVAAGQTSQKKLGYIAASDGTNDGVTYLMFVGELAKSSSNAEVVWNEDDAINVNLVLKVTAGPKTYPTTT